MLTAEPFGYFARTFADVKKKKSPIPYMKIIGDLNDYSLMNFSVRLSILMMYTPDAKLETSISVSSLIM